MTATSSINMDLITNMIPNNNKSTGTMNKSFDDILNLKQSAQSIEQISNTISKRHLREKDAVRDHATDRSSNIANDNKEIEAQVDVKKLKDEVTEKVTEKVTEILGISKEELDDALAQLNLSIMDLFVPSNLQLLLTEVLGKDVSSLLVNTEFAFITKELRSSIYNIMNEHGIKAEDLQKLIADNIKQEQPDLISKDTNLEDNRNIDTNKQIVIIDKRLNISDANDKNSLDMSTNQSKSLVNIFNQNVQQAETFTMNAVQEIVHESVNPENLINQLVSKVRIILNDDKTSMFIQLKPEHLGKLAFSLTSRDGLVTANFTAENTVVKELIETNLIRLQDTLEEQGIKIDKIEVFVGENNLFQNQEEKNEYQEQKKNGRIARLMADDNTLEEIDVTKLSEDLFAGTTHIVDYSA